MLTLFIESLTWWHWIVFGCILLIVEMNTGTFIMLGLGLSAIIVGLLSFFIPLDFRIAVSIFALLSLLIIWAWKHYFKHPSSTNIGQSNHTFDTLGTAITDIPLHKRGEVRFDTPVLGTSVWFATAEESINKDTRIEIVDINGQLIVVKALHT
jgi:membrane protein implicated in regulation of membrane protease activity